MGPFRKGLFHDNFSIGIHIEETPFGFFAVRYYHGSLENWVTISLSASLIFKEKHCKVVKTL